MILLTVLKKGSFALGVTALSAAATWVFTGPLLAIAVPEPRAWIDDPLPGAVVPPGEEISIVTHATDRSGVDLVILRVDGIQVDAKTGGGRSLVTMQFEWTPPGEGTYELEVRGRGDDGLGAPGLATITVGALEESGPPATTSTTLPDGDAPAQEDPEDPESDEEPDGSATTAPPRTTIPGPTVPPTTQTTIPRTTPTTTSTPTTTVCQEPPPTLLSPADGAAVSAAVQLRWSYNGCAVDGFLVELYRNPLNPPYGTSGVLGPAVRNWAPPDGFPCDGRPWHWRVGALDGRAIRWSTMWSFTC